MADFVVTITNKGRQLEAQQLLYGYGFKISHFVLGSGGHGDPLVPLSLDLNALTLPQQFFGPKLIDVATMISTTCPQFTCIAQAGEAVGGISNLGLLATIISVPAGSPTTAPAVHSQFLYAMTNFPLRTKTAFSKETFNVFIRS